MKYISIFNTKSVHDSTTARCNLLPFKPILQQVASNSTICNTKREFLEVGGGD